MILSLAGDVVIGGSSDGKWARVLACCLDSRKVSFSWPSAFKEGVATISNVDFIRMGFLPQFFF